METFTFPRSSGSNGRGIPKKAPFAKLKTPSTPFLNSPEDVKTDLESMCDCVNI